MTAQRHNAPQAKGEQSAKRPPRPCMCCGKPFASQGNHNRLCGTCRTGATSTDWMTVGGTSTGKVRRAASQP